MFSQIYTFIFLFLHLAIFTESSTMTKTPTTITKTNNTRTRFLSAYLTGNNDPWNASVLFTHFNSCLPRYQDLNCYMANNVSIQPNQMVKTYLSKNEVQDPKEYCQNSFDYVACLLDVTCDNCNLTVVTAVERFCMAAFKIDGDARFCGHYVQMNDLLGRCTWKGFRGVLLAEVIIIVLFIIALNCVICGCFCCLPCKEDGNNTDQEIKNNLDKQDDQKKSVIFDDEKDG